MQKRTEREASPRRQPSAKGETLRRGLALVTMAVAAIGSIASTGPTSDPFGSWSLTENATGPALVLGSAETAVSKHVTAGINAATLEDGGVYGSMSIDATACVATTGTGSAMTLRALLVPDAPANGPVIQKPIPVCGAGAEIFHFGASPFGTCTDGQPCYSGYTAVFERIGTLSSGSAVQITWDLSASVMGFGEDDIPPAGSDLTLEVEP